MYPNERTKKFEELVHIIIRSNYKMIRMRNEGHATSAEYHALRKNKKEAERELKELEARI